MEFILALILLAAVFAALAFPFYRPRARAVVAFSGTLNDLLAQRDGVYATLRDLDLDYQLGKLDATDYQARREKYLTRAAVLLQQLDALRGADAAHRDLSEEIEREVAALRRSPKTNDQRRKTGNGRSSSVLRPRSSVACSNCGRPYASGDRYCAKCGQAL